MEQREQKLREETSIFVKKFLNSNNSIFDLLLNFSKSKAVKKYHSKNHANQTNLPTDEEIEKQSHLIDGADANGGVGHVYWSLGAKWMRDNYHRKEVDLTELKKKFQQAYNRADHYSLESVNSPIDELFNVFLPYLQQPAESDAVEFAEWCKENYEIEYYPGGWYWLKRDTTLPPKLTTEELYNSQEFKDYKNNKNK